MREVTLARLRNHRALGVLLWAVASVQCAEAAAPPKATAELQRTLAPTGSLQVAVYAGSSTSLVDKNDLRGVGFELGREFARRLGVPFKPLVFANNAEVLNAMKTGRADIAFTNATAERAEYMDFTQPYIMYELGYLARDGAAVTSLADVDRPGVRVGVTARSSSDAELSRSLKHAQLVRSENAARGAAMLADASIDVYATNKPILFDMANRLEGAHVLDGRWGVERYSMGLPKGREGGLGFARAFIAEAVASGVVSAAVDRAGLRGSFIPGSSDERDSGQSSR
jgi:polar amino acid transport system substrate-binding protein